MGAVLDGRTTGSVSGASATSGNKYGRPAYYSQSPMRRRSGVQVHDVRTPLVVSLGVIVAVLLVSLPVLEPGGLGATEPSSNVLNLSGLYKSATLLPGALVGHHLASPFYAVVFTDSGLSLAQLQTLGAYFNTTPITWFRFGGGGDAYDPTTNTYYSAPPSGGTYTAHSAIVQNFTWMKAWCYSRTPHCDWLGYLPGQENNTPAALHTATWFHDLGFVPNLWQFDNEPDKWTHYGENRSVWSTTDNSVPTGMDYATMVKDYIATVSKAFPKDQYVGIEASCACAATWYINDTAQVDGSKVAAMAYHSYPGIPGGSTSLSQFFGALAAPTNVSGTVTHFRAQLTSQCGSCQNLPIEIGEYQTGPPITHSPFALQYAGAPWLAASVIQALRANVSMFTEFDSTWLVNYTTGAVEPEGTLYQRILENMTMGDDYAVNVSAHGLGGIYSVLVKNGTRQSLLVVNTNTTAAIRLSVGSTIFPLGVLGNEYLWDRNLALPQGSHFASLPGSYVVPAGGILLVNNF